MIKHLSAVAGALALPGIVAAPALWYIPEITLITMFMGAMMVTMVAVYLGILESFDKR